MRTLIFVGLLVIGLIYNWVHTSESEHPRPGYVDTGGPSMTYDECVDQGGNPVDDVCYMP